ATCGGGASSTSISCRVTYSCSGATCTRTEAKPDGTSPGPAVQVVSGLSSSNVFAYTAPTSTAPAYVGVTLAFPAKDGSDAITLADGAALRTPGSGSASTWNARTPSAAKSPPTAASRSSRS